MKKSGGVFRPIFYIINAYCHYDILIPALIKLSHFSQSHLSRLIKKQFNMTLKEYINELRLQHAYNEIIITPKPFESIAYDIGFSSFSHFNKIFKARFSITPSRLRKIYGIQTI
jgi:AraC-like DNA-binding protein